MEEPDYTVDYSDAFGDNSKIDTCTKCGCAYEMEDLLSYDRCPLCEEPGQRNTTN